MQDIDDNSLLIVYFICDLAINKINKSNQAKYKSKIKYKITISC